MAKPAVNQSSVSKVYQAVIDDVINNVREAFLDDGVDEHVLQELKRTWEAKLLQSKAIDNPQHHLTQPGLSVYTPVVYKTIPDGMQALPMTAAGQQATLALPTNVPIVYHQKLPTATSAQAQMYTAYQPSRQAAQQPGTQTVIVTQRQGGQEKSNKQGPSAIIQVDGAADHTDLQTTDSEIEKIEPEHTKTNEYPCSSKTTPAKPLKKLFLPQIDGGADSSSSEDDDDDEDEDDEDEEDEDESKNSSEVVEEPLCSDDDGSDEDPVALFDTDNVVVCQYDKIHRAKARWKFNLKLGIMNLNGKDMVFQKATGEADW